VQDEPKRDAITRREALRRIAAGAVGLALSGPLGALAASVRQPKARSVIQIWMWGGPSHLDTFDPKPGLGRDYCGPFDTAIPTNVEGIQVNAQLPLLAMQADKYSIIRSMTHGSTAHETASYLVQTGREPGRLVYPSAGAVVSLLKGYRAGYRGSAPPYIVLTQPQGRFSEAGFLGSEYGPFATGGDPSRDPFEVEGIVAPGVSDERQLRRRELLHALDTLGRAAPSDPYFAQLDRREQEAYDTMFGEVKQIFDLSQEAQEIRERYGRNTFGQACLVARRLVEHGVPYVTINYEGWDTHKQHFDTLSWKQPQMDRGMATLLQDLSDRGLLGSTIVWWGGEFGRTPKIDWEPPWNGGRGHYSKCFSVVVAGGGFRGGRVVGASSKTGEEVAERPVHPRDLLASMYTLLAIDPEGPLPNSRGLDARVLPADEAGAQSGSLLTEIM
jgi:hypothetical protein